MRNKNYNCNFAKKLKDFCFANKLKISIQTHTFNLIVNSEKNLIKNYLILFSDVNSICTFEKII